VRIPEFFWKIVFSKNTGRGLMILTSNAPYPIDSITLLLLRNSPHCFDCPFISSVTSKTHGETFCFRNISNVFSIFQEDCDGFNELLYLPTEIKESQLTFGVFSQDANRARPHGA
jgi:hypothetical protein